MAGRALAAALVALSATGAAAQRLPGFDLTAWATNDERRQGLSWSAGRPTIGVAAGLSAGALRLEADGFAARGSSRHGGADAAIGVAALAGQSFGGVRLEAGGRANLFPGGRGAQDFAELATRADWTIGPVRLGATADYAPKQASLGGDLLRLRATGRLSLLGTPWGVSVAGGRTSGRTDNPARAARLRPDDAYRDWRIGVDRALGPVTLALDYIGTDLRRARDAGDRIVVRIETGF